MQLLPPCNNACPVHTDVRGYLAAIAQGDYHRAYSLIKAYNPFPSVCAWICLHPCEEACRRAQIDDPVAIRSLKRFAVEKGVTSPASRHNIARSGKKVAVVGSGPAGLTAAQDLALLGHQVTVYERHRAPGGHFVSSLPLFRLPRAVLERDVANIFATGITLVSETEIGKDISLEQLRSSYDAVLICTGLWGGRRVAGPGFDHREILSALPFLEQANSGARVPVGPKVAVIGGGNVAMDVARAAVRLGAAEVTVVSLESREEMPASPWEIAEATDEGVLLLPGFGPQAVLTEAGRITGLTLQAVQSVFDEKGRFNPVFHPDRCQTLPADTIILSIGQGPETSFVRGSSLETDRLGYLVMNRETLETSLPGVFAAGEIAAGPGPAIAAVASGHRGAERVHRYLSADRGTVPVSGKLVSVASGGSQITNHEDRGTVLVSGKMVSVEGGTGDVTAGTGTVPVSAMGVDGDGGSEVLAGVVAWMGRDEAGFVPIGVIPGDIAARASAMERRVMSVTAAEERIRSFQPYQAGLDEAGAQWEARRCLSCGLGAQVDRDKCVGCLTCRRVCPYTSPQVGEKAEITPEKCLVCGVCAVHCPTKAITIGLLSLPTEGFGKLQSTKHKAQMEYNDTEGAIVGGDGLPFTASADWRCESEGSGGVAQVQGSVEGDYGINEPEGLLDAASVQGSVEGDLSIRKTEAAGYKAIFICRGVCAGAEGESWSPAEQDWSQGDRVRLTEIPTAGALRLEQILSAFEDNATEVQIIACPPDKCRHPLDQDSCLRIYRRAQKLLPELGIPESRISYCSRGEK